MLQSIRDHTHGWIAGTIISLLIFSFALWGIHSYFVGFGGSDVIAKVNSVEITKSQLSVTYERLRRQMQMQSGVNEQLPAGQEIGLKHRALESLIDLQVLKQASLAADYRVVPAQIDGYLESIPAFQINGEFSVARFQQALAATLFSEQDFLELIGTSLLIDQPRLGLVFSSYALPNEVENVIALVEQERDIQYLTLSSQLIPSQSLTISASDVKAYYDQHQSEFQTLEQASVEYVILSAKDLADKIHSTEDELKKFYNDNTQTFVQPAQWQLDELVLPVSATATEQEIQQAQTKIDEIKKMANSGKDFAALMKQYGSSNKLQQWVSVEQVPVELQKPVSELTKLGQISVPVRTNEGFVLLKVVGYKAPKSQPYEAVKPKVQEMLAKQQAEETFTDKREKLANLTYEHPDTLQDAAKTLGLAIKTSDLFTKDKNGKDAITANTKVREAAFSSDVLVQQNNSDVIQIDPDTAVVVRVKSHVPAVTLQFSAVQEKIMDKLKAKLLDEKLSQLASDIRTKLQAGTLTPEQVASQYNLKWNDVGFVGRHGGKIDQAILDVAFSMPAPKSDLTQDKLTKDSSRVVYATAKVENGFTVIGLTAVKNGTSPSSKDQYRAFAEQVQNSQGAAEYELYKAGLIRSAKIVIENQ